MKKILDLQITLVLLELTAMIFAPNQLYEGKMASMDWYTGLLK